MTTTKAIYTVLIFGIFKPRELRVPLWLKASALLISWIHRQHGLDRTLVSTATNVDWNRTRFGCCRWRRSRYWLLSRFVTADRWQRRCFWCRRRKNRATGGPLRIIVTNQCCVWLSLLLLRWSSGEERFESSSFQLVLFLHPHKYLVVVDRFMILEKALLVDLLMERWFTYHHTFSRYRHVPRYTLARNTKYWSMPIKERGGERSFW